MYQTATTNLKANSYRNSMFAALLALFALLMIAAPVFAKAPPLGTVYEGKSVPGAALGATRGDVFRSFGEPRSCSSISPASLLTSSTYTCTFTAEQGGSVDVRFLRSKFSPVPSDKDTVINIKWSQEVSGWTTTAGINTRLAVGDPLTVVKAYPKASVKYNTLGQIIQVKDAQLGIQIDWTYAASSDDELSKVSMAIFPALQVTP